MNTLFDSIEGKLQSLLEETLDRLFYAGLGKSLSNQLIHLIDAELQTQSSSETKLVPDIITIIVSTEKSDAWQEIRPMLDNVSEQLYKTWSDLGYSFKSPLHINIKVSSANLIDEVRVETNFSEDSNNKGHTALQSTARPLLDVVLPRGAYFIINGKEQVYLTKKIVNIGRRSTSDIILKDPMVSRDHLQLRAENGHYLMFDLSSTGGTFVNNHLTKSTLLKPGDVLRLGKTMLIFNQDLSGVSSQTKIMTID